MDTFSSVSLGIILILMACIFKVFHSATPEFRHDKKIANLVTAIIFSIIGASFILLTIGCHKFGTVTTDNSKHEIYCVDNEYIKWSGESNKTANIYVMGENDTISLKPLTNAAFGYCNNNETAYYLQTTVTKKFLFFTIKDYEYIIYTPN